MYPAALEALSHIEDLEKEIEELRDINQSLVDRYNDILLCVEEKHPGLSRHDTAIMMIDLAKRYREGYQGACYACETVGELNLKLKAELDALYR